jgi:hypothetical protein
MLNTRREFTSHHLYKDHFTAGETFYLDLDSTRGRLLGVLMRYCQCASVIISRTGDLKHERITTVTWYDGEDRYCVADQCLGHALAKSILMIWRVKP